MKTYNSKFDLLGDLSNRPEEIKQLRTIKCLPEMSGESVVFWDDVNMDDE